MPYDPTSPVPGSRQALPAWHAPSGQPAATGDVTRESDRAVARGVERVPGNEGGREGEGAAQSGAGRDRVSLSPQVAQAGTGMGEGEEAAAAESSEPEAEKGRGDEELTSEEKAEVRELEGRDREVRSHEQAHLAAGGRYVRGGARFSYQTGPDGERYAVGGEVGIDTSRERSPEATIQKAQVVRRAALAPAEPSSQDRAVAAQANRMEAEARVEMARDERGAAQEERATKAERAEKTRAAQEAQGLEAGPTAEEAEGPTAGPEGLTAAAGARYSGSTAPPPPGQLLDVVA